jgi:chaperone modulatory protein CbpM
MSRHSSEQEGILLDESGYVTLAELMRACSLSAREIRELVEFGVFEPQLSGAEWVFTFRSIRLARSASRLKNDFGLNLAGIALALTYLERIEELEKRVQELECQLLK